MLIPSTTPHRSAQPTEHRLTQLLRPRSVALVGASDRSNWSSRIYDALQVIGYDGDVYLVNPKGGQAHGRPLHRQVGDIGTVPDVAFLMVPGPAVLDAMRDVAVAGVKAAVVLSSGFAELGAEGREAQDELASLCRRHEMVVLGPNALGFVNVIDRIALKPFPPGEPLRPGSIGVVSQSGNITVQLINMARSFDIGLSFAVSTGNEMDVSLADVVDFLAEDESTAAIAVFAESFADPAAFLAACRKARASGKPVVVLKVGRSAAAARAALAHTGALVGNDAVVDAFLRSAGAIRVTALEDLLAVADTFTRTGALERAGLAVLTISGGTCDIAADTADARGVELPEFAPRTLERLRTVLPGYATAQNPLDVTGAAVTDAELFGRALRIVTGDPNIGVVLVAQEIDYQAETSAWGAETLRGLVAASSGGTVPGDPAPGGTVPVILANTTVRAVSARVREIRAELEVPAVFGGIDRILPAVRAITDWSAQAREAEAPLPPVTPLRLPAEPRGAWSEAVCRDLLTEAGIPVVPGVVARTPAAAGAAAAAYGGLVALKVVSPDVLHKSDIGGVALQVAAADAEQAAAALLRRVATAVPAARVDGVLVSPMRPDGLDLLIGVVREPGWGNVLAIGLGGLWAEAIRDVQRIALPASERQIEQGLGRLKAWPLFEGARGGDRADIPALVGVVARIADLSLGLGDQLAAVEVNPLRVTPAGAEALDAVVVWRDRGCRG
ncbi:MAG: acetate--CoA ligase family protein [Trebonia sp.]|jgi:acyl-CoA synthetase (NDP forming)